MMAKRKEMELKGFKIEIQLREETLFIEGTSREDGLIIYWLQISHDTMLSNKMIFQSPKELYEYLEEDQFSDKCLQFNPPHEIIILYKIGKNTKQINLFMTQKILTKQQQLQLSIKGLQSENKKLLNLLQENNEDFKLMELQMILEEKDRQILMLNALNQQQRDEIRKLKSQIEEFSKRKDEKGENGRFQDQQQSKNIQEVNKSKILTHEQTISSQTLIIKELQYELKESKEIISALTSENKFTKYQVINHQIFGHFLTFKPNKNSINNSFYDFNANILTKNNESLSGTGKFIFSDTPIPKVGRFHYKIKHKYSKTLPNYRLGVIGRQNLQSEVYMNAGQTDSVMYYCYNTDKEIIYQGHNKFEGFHVKKNEVMTILIDAEKNQVEWYLQQNLQTISKFTESMKTAPELFFFIQLWQNGDSLEIIAQ